MGQGRSKGEQQLQEKADGIRKNLNKRVVAFLGKYGAQYGSIATERKEVIKESSALELAQLMDEGTTTSYEIVLVFCWRTATIGVKNGYVVDQYFEEALEKAKKIDAIRKGSKGRRSWRYGDQVKDTFPPFFGVPYSVKDSILYPGKITYCGHAQPVNPVLQSQNQFSILTEKMGLIPFVRSSVPQACKTYDTNNLIVGYSKNPWDETRSCNGSSGGEAGLIASQCSPFGIGSDIANSLRGPADFTGLATLKPYYRYSNLGSAYTGSYANGIFLRNEMGPMSRSVKDVTLWNYFMYDKQNYHDIPRKLKDPYLRLNPFRYEVFTQKKQYKIGYFTEFKGDLKCSPTHQRAVFQSLRMAEEQGHSTVQIDLKDAQEMFLIVTRMWYGNTDLSILKEISSGEKPIPQYSRPEKLSLMNPVLRSLIANLLSVIEPRMSRIIKTFKPFSVKDYFFMLAEINDYRKKIYAYLQQKQIDLIICPGWYLPAFKLGTASDFGYCVNYTHIWNCLNYAAGSIPVTVVRQDQQYMDDCFKDKIWKDANKAMKGSAGLPVGIQVVSYPGNQEEVLYLMEQLEDKIGFRKKYQSKQARKNP